MFAAVLQDGPSYVAAYPNQPVRWSLFYVNLDQLPSWMNSPRLFIPADL
jgi:hypothetical protein